MSSFLKKPMTKRELINLCLECLNVYEDYPFSEAAPNWAVIRHLGSKKGFAHIFDYKSELCINLKLNPFEGELLRQNFDSITAAYHLNKEHWNMVKLGGDVPIELLKDLIQKSYGLTAVRHSVARIKNKNENSFTKS